MKEIDLKKELEASKKIIAAQREQIMNLETKVGSLEAKILILLKLLESQSVKKDSHNSSLPPSSDFYNPKTKSLRAKSDRKSGGQLGHDGTTLKMSPTPTTITDLKSDYCSECGASLVASTYVLKASRQVIEIPPIEPIYNEFRQYGCECPLCKHNQIADFPPGVNSPIQYGSTVESLVSYLSVYQYVPFGRLQNLFTQVFSLPLSQGTVGNILQRTAIKCEGVYQMIKTQIAESQVVGSDETSTKVNGKKWWIWVWQNVLNTFIVASDNRGSETINNIWEIGLPNAVLVTDRGATQLKSNTKGHQICLAHLLRNSIFFDESEKHPYSAQFKQFIIDVFDARKKLIIQKTPYQNDHQQAIDLEKKLNELLLMTIDKHLFPNTLTFQLSMLKLRNHLLPCLYNLDIPLTIMVLKEPFVISKSNKRSLGSLNQGKMLSVSCALS